jgi:hypothetical protein
LRSKVLRNQFAEVLTSVIDDGSGSIESAKDVGLDEFYHNLVIIGLGGHSFYPLGDIIHSYQNILIPKRQWKGSHEIDTLDIKNFNYEDLVQWHHISLGHSS